MLTLYLNPLQTQHTGKNYDYDYIPAEVVTLFCALGHCNVSIFK